MKNLFRHIGFVLTLIVVLSSCTKEQFEHCPEDSTMQTQQAKILIRDADSEHSTGVVGSDRFEVKNYDRVPGLAISDDDDDENDDDGKTISDDDDDENEDDRNSPGYRKKL